MSVIVCSQKQGTKPHIFYLFGARKYRLFLSFQYTKKDDYFLTRKVKKRLSYRMFSML